jgi:serine/threonine protein kinase
MLAFTSSSRRVLIPSLILTICCIFFVSTVIRRTPATSSVEYSASLGQGSQAKAYPAIIKVNNGIFDLKKYMTNEADILQKVRGDYVVKLYGQYTDSDGLDVLVLEKIPGKPIFRPAEVYKATLDIKMRVLRELLQALQDIHGKGICLP